MGLLKAAIILAISVGIANFIQKNAMLLSSYPFYPFISPYIENKAYIVIITMVFLMVLI
jgi:hypothetical protein